jgi:uncharacterized protein YdaU (DUF1376 family)
MSLPWFKMYGSAFLVDTIRLSTEQKGAYLMLILDYYDKEAPPPDDDGVLASITGLPLERWQGHRRMLEPFFAIEGGVWRHARCEEELVSRQAKIDANRENGKRPKRKRKATGQANGQATGLPTGIANGVPTAQANDEPDFGPSRPSVTAPSHFSAENGTNVPQSTQQEAIGLASGLANGIPNGSQSLDKKTLREGANAPSPASGSFELIGSLIDPAYQPSAQSITLALKEAPSTELAGWLDDWKQRCMDAGTRATDWNAAWDRELHRRMTERAKNRPKPKVSVSKKQRLTALPEDWKPNERHVELANDRKLDIALCVESFADHITNKRPDWSDADAAFRNWLKSPHRTEFIRHGQATQRRAPAPGNGGSILDAFDRLDATLAGGGGAPAQDQSHGKALVHRVPEE